MITNLRGLLIFKRILPVNIKGGVERTLWKICKLIQGCIVLKEQSTDVLSPCRCQRVASMVIRGINR